MGKKYKVAFVVLAATAIVLLATLYLRHTTIAVLDPAGPISQQERQLIIITLLLSAIVVIPVFALLFGFAWKYRDSNVNAKYSPDLDHSRLAETIWWLIPTALISVVAVITWDSSHALDPYKPLASAVTPIPIQVVAMDWKWLFIYPRQNLASVNFMQFPVNTPVNFQITADAPMNSFWIPQLGGQIYAMPGMDTQLHLLASRTGNFYGSSANISGQGFANMNFVAKASSAAAFKQWVNKVKRSPDSLNVTNYKRLAEPNVVNKVTYYSTEQADLFNRVLMKYMMPGMQSMDESSDSVAAAGTNGMVMQ